MMKFVIIDANFLSPFYDITGEREREKEKEEMLTRK
jgi:hypothetical protein